MQPQRLERLESLDELIDIFSPQLKGPGFVHPTSVLKCVAEAQIHLL